MIHTFWQLVTQQDSVQMILMFISIPFGLIVGSALNALMFRLKNGMNFMTGRSECVHCEKQLSWFELIPLLSFLVLRGKCRSCRGIIPRDYFLVELFASVLFFYSTVIFSTSTEILFGWIIVTFSVLIFVYDLKHMLIEDRVTVTLMIIIALYNLIVMPSAFLTHLFTGFGIALFFIAQILATRGKGVGGGDIRLGFIIGLLLGYPFGVFALLSAYIIALLWILPLLAVKKVTMKSKIPLGPFLVIGMLLFFFHQNIDMSVVFNWLMFGV